ncbi:MAB_1171c family putative transporter [Streptomyces griseorubiginosus]|uniref:MAB_1171c family putative transporter n=1 Tax=Streptomyces griseorubiginosus TaxID=67304 RepID=UPI003669B8D9
MTVVTLLGGTLWTLPPLIRQRFRAPMRLHLCLSMFLLGMGNVLGQMPGHATLDGLTFTGFTKLTYNVAILTGLCLMIGFLGEQPLRRRSLIRRWEVLLCLSCLTAMTVLTLTLPPQLRDHTLAAPYLDDWRVRAFYDIGGAYLVLGYGRCALLAARYARRGRPLRRISLNAVSAGLLGLSLSCAFRILWVNLPASHGFGHHVTYVNAFAFGQMAAIVVCAGLSLPCLASTVRFLRERSAHRARYRGLEELWQRLVDLYPELVLDRSHRYRSLAPLDYSSAVYRRYVECRDGLTRLSPYLQRAARDLTTAEGGAPAGSDLVRLVDRALRLHGDTDIVADTAAAPSIVVAPGGGHDADYESDLGGLVDLSRGLRERRTAAGASSSHRCTQAVPRPGRHPLKAVGRSSPRPAPRPPRQPSAVRVRGDGPSGA